MAAFLREALRVAAMDLEGTARDAGPVFFDRGLIDAAAALQRLCGVPLAQSLGESRPYGRLVFLAPPWPDIYCADEARRHGFPEAEAEYAHLVPPTGHSATKSGCFRVPAWPSGPTSFSKRFVSAEGEANLWRLPWLRCTSDRRGRAYSGMRTADSRCTDAGASGWPGAGAVTISCGAVRSITGGCTAAWPAMVGRPWSDAGWQPRPGSARTGPGDRPSPAS